jgi:Ca2+-binding EF-hand superfamily protein
MPVEVAPSRQAGGRPPRRDSDIASAARRISLSQRTSISRIQQVDVERAQKAAQAKDVRRRSSLARMWVTDSARSQVQSLLEDAASEISTGESKGEGPQRRLQHLLSSAKERGMSAERLFEYFAPDGASTISRDAFELALDSIAPTYGKLSSEDINELFCDFDSNGNGVIDLSEFVEWCMAIPTLAWKAEKARQLGNCDSTDNLAEAARNIERRRSLSKAIPIGKKVSAKWDILCPPCLCLADIIFSIFSCMRARSSSGVRRRIWILPSMKMRMRVLSPSTLALMK